MRKLITKDIFAACRALKACGAKDEIEKVAKTADTAADAWAKGFDLMWGIFDKATEKNAEQPIYDFFAGPFEMSADAVSEMELADLIDALRRLAEENNLIAFFRYVGKLMK